MAAGIFRMIWPGEALRAAGHDVDVVPPGDRQVRLHMSGDEVTKVETDADVIVFQRTTHERMAQAVSVLRRQGVAVVVDIDDDLTAIHPSNPAWAGLHPRSKGDASRHSWRNLSDACRNATLVTVSTPALLPIYAAHGRGRVLHNYLPDCYDGLAHTDSDELAWPASYHSHPNDPDAVGGAISRLVTEGAPFRMIGDPEGAGRAFGLERDPEGGAVPIDQWPQAVAGLGIGIAPLADTRFNRSKSWLKPLEMCAAGVPWVASPRAEYVRLSKLGEAGVLAERPRVWYRELKRLRESAALRQELSEAGREVARGLRLSDHAWRWMDAWTHAYETQRASRSPVPLSSP